MPITPFFPPSSEITGQLIRRISQRRAAALRQAMTETAVEADEDPSESDELRSSIVAALEEEVTVADDWSDRRWLSEIIYHFLGRLAGRSHHGGPSEFRLSECLIEGMGARLGLDAPEDVALLETLAGEFSDWMIKNAPKGYVAGWGKIVVDSSDPEKLCFKPLSKARMPFQ